MLLDTLDTRGQPPEPRAADLAACEALLRHGSKSFAMAARLLPARVRGPATVLYAFCRVADDCIDGDPNATEASVRGLRRRLELAYAGTPADDPVDRALAAVVSHGRIPLPLLDALLEGLSWDAAGRRYETLDDLYAYAARVAGTVGAMMTVLMGPREADVLARACDLGVAMQLTNIARDVGEDAARGRIYLPLSWLRDADVDPERLAAGVDPGGVRAVVRRLLETADVLYARADAGIARLPPDCRIAIRAASLIYSEIGRRIAQRGFDSMTHRAFVPRWRKVWLLVRAIAARWRRGPIIAAPPLEPTRFLVRACTEGAS